MKPPACFPHCNTHLDAFVAVLTALALGYVVGAVVARSFGRRRLFRVWLVGMVAAVGAYWSYSDGWREGLFAAAAASMWLAMLGRVARERKAGPPP